MLQTGMLVNGRYEVRELIGRGGMSQVFRARDRITNADLAIKEALHDSAKDAQTAELGLSVEGNLLKRLSNPHLPRIYEVIENGDDIMIVMDYVEGQSLDKVLNQRGAIPAEQVIEWGIQICDVFHYLHTQNPPIIYRDMKPANVILRPDGNIMLIDFGTARRWKVDANRTSDTMLIGTEGFAAPEQFGGRGQSDARTDIFCLGATMFNLVTNHSPYMKPFGITPLGDWDPALKDSELDRIIQKCTANDPYQRFQTARDLKEALIAAKEAPGKTGFLRGRNRSKEKGTTRRTKGWQTPPIKVSTGESRILTPEDLAKHAPVQPAGMQYPPNPEAANAAYWQQPSPQPAYQPQPVYPQGYYPQAAGYQQPVRQETVPAQETPREEESSNSLWKVFMLVGLIAGFVLLVLAVVLLFLYPLAGIIVAVLAVGVAVFGVISTLKYVKQE